MVGDMKAHHQYWNAQRADSRGKPKHSSFLRNTDSSFILLNELQHTTLPGMSHQASIIDLCK